MNHECPRCLGVGFTFFDSVVVGWANLVRAWLGEPFRPRCRQCSGTGVIQPPLSKLDLSRGTRLFFLGMARADDAEGILESPELPPAIHDARARVQALREELRERGLVLLHQHRE